MMSTVARCVVRRGRAQRVACGHGELNVTPGRAALAPRRGPQHERVERDGDGAEHEGGGGPLTVADVTALRLIGRDDLIVAAHKDGRSNLNQNGA